MKKGLAIINMLVILAVIAWNYYTTIEGFNGNEVGSVSDNLANLFTPAGYAFSIWGIIFLGLIITGIMMLVIAFGKEENGIVERVAPALIAANLFNCAWVYVWLSLMTGTSTIIMSLILVSLIITALRIESSKVTKSSLYKWTIGVPIRIYLGWIMVATVANFSAYLNTTSFPNIMGETPWFYIMIGVATAIICYVVYKKSWYEVSGVGLWAFLAIVVRHLSEQTNLAYFTLACMVIIAGIAITRFVQNRNLGVQIQ